MVVLVSFAPKYLASVQKKCWRGRNKDIRVSRVQNHSSQANPPWTPVLTPQKSRCIGPYGGRRENLKGNNVILISPSWFVKSCNQEPSAERQRSHSTRRRNLKFWEGEDKKSKMVNSNQNWTNGGIHLFRISDEEDTRIRWMVIIRASEIKKGESDKSKR